jgi:hypothetical protein
MFGGAISGHPEVSSHVIVQAVAVFGQHTLTKPYVYNIHLLFGKILSDFSKSPAISTTRSREPQLNIYAYVSGG